MPTITRDHYTYDTVDVDNHQSFVFLNVPEIFQEILQFFLSFRQHFESIWSLSIKKKKAAKQVYTRFLIKDS